MRLRAMLAGLALGLATASAYSDGLQGQMDKMFGQMSTAAPPQTAIDARRGVISGGSLAIRSPVTPPQASMMNFTPPSFSAGCSGIDLYGGSFSFISGQQFVQMLRGIAANAEGLAFQMALQSMSSQLSQQLSSFSDKMQSMVGSMKNSCEIAHSALDNTSLGNQISSFGTSVGKSLSVSSGDVSDSASAESTDTPQNPIASQAAQKHPDQMKPLVFPNIMWRALADHKIASAFGDGSSVMLQQELMSLTGTVIVCNPQSDSNCAAGDGGSTGITYVAPTLKLEDLVYGSTSGSAVILVCDEPKDCKNPTQQVWHSKGFLDFVTSALGTDGTTGVLGSLLTNQPADPQVSAFLANAGAAGPLLLRVGRVNPGAMTGFAQAIAQPLALEMAHKQAIQLINVAASSLVGIDNPAAKDMEERLRASREQIDREYSSMRNQSAFNVDATQLADTYIQTAPDAMPSSAYGNTAVN